MFFFSKGSDEGPIVKTCRCGLCFTANAWLDLRFVGHMDSGDDDTILELRNCPCGSTIAMEIHVDAAPSLLGRLLLDVIAQYGTHVAVKA